MSIDINEILNEQDKGKEPVQDDLLEQKFSPEKAELSRKSLVDMRRRIAGGEAIPEDELKDALLLIREMYGREALAAAAKKKPAAKKKAAPKKAAPKVNADDLLNDILGSL